MLSEFDYQNNPILIDKRKLKQWHVLSSNGDGQIIKTVEANWYYMKAEYTHFKENK